MTGECVVGVGVGGVWCMCACTCRCAEGWGMVEIICE